MTRPIYLLGGGGHGKVLIDTLSRLNLVPIGIVDNHLETGWNILGIKVVGGDDYLETMNPDDIALVNGIGANPKISLRRSLFQSFRAGGYQFERVIHPSVIRGGDLELGEGCQILAGAVLQSGVQVGLNAVVNTGARIDHDCRIGAHCFIGPGAILCGEVTLGDSVFIGAGAILLPGVRIGENAVIGAGSLVTKSIPASWVAVGSPARKMGETEC